jgi:hypothetical protein
MLRLGVLVHRPTSLLAAPDQASHLSGRDAVAMIGKGGEPCRVRHHLELTALNSQYIVNNIFLISHCEILM